MTEFAAIGGRSGIARGPDGNVWYTTGTASAGSGRPARQHRVSVPSGATWDILAGPDGNLWYTTGGKIGRITTSGVATEFSVPGGAAIALAVGPDGNLWFTEDYNDGYGRITTHGAVTEFFDAAPSGLATGSDGNLWYVTEVRSDASPRRRVPPPNTFCPGTIRPPASRWAPMEPLVRRRGGEFDRPDQHVGRDRRISDSDGLLRALRHHRRTGRTSGSPRPWPERSAGSA